MLPYLTNEREAKLIAKRLFEYYDRDGSSAIENYEAQGMIGDVYKGLARKKEVTIDEAN